MSCGQHHQTHCQEVLLHVYQYLDGEMAPADTERIKLHLEECAPCLREYGIEDAVKALVKRSHPCDKPPVQLRERVLLGLGQVPLSGPGPSAPRVSGPVPTSFGWPVAPADGGLPGFGS